MGEAPIGTPALKGINMSALPPSELLPGPQMMSLGFSLAALAFAETDEELAERLGKLTDDAREVREKFAALRDACHQLEDAAAKADTTQLRLLLDGLLALERGLVNAAEALDGILRKTTWGGYGSVLLFHKELTNEYLPLIRELRLRTICVIAERANVAGVNILEISDEFRETFRKASFDETGGWQETAYILANIEGAKSLSRSVESIATDRTEEIMPAPADGRVA